MKKTDKLIQLAAKIFCCDRLANINHWFFYKSINKVTANKRADD